MIGTQADPHAAGGEQPDIRTLSAQAAFDSGRWVEFQASRGLARSRTLKSSDGKCACSKHRLPPAADRPEVKDHLDESGWWHTHDVCFEGPA